MLSSWKIMIILSYPHIFMVILCYPSINVSCIHKGVRMYMYLVNFKTSNENEYYSLIQIHSRTWAIWSSDIPLFQDCISCVLAVLLATSSCINTSMVWTCLVTNIFPCLLLVFVWTSDQNALKCWCCEDTRICASCWIGYGLRQHGWGPGVETHTKKWLQRVPPF